MTSGAHDDTTIALATWATGLQRDAIPSAAARALVWHHLDSVGCAVGAIEPVAGVRASDDLLAVLADLDALRTLASMFDALRVLNPAS